jgi:hypothetical protein
MKRLVKVCRYGLVAAWLFGLGLVGLHGAVSWQSAPVQARGACSPDFQVPGCPINPTPAPNPGSSLANPSCVQIALPWATGSTKCVPNRDPGGAIIAYLKVVLYVLGGGIGVVILLVLVVAGVQYVTSLGDPGRVKSAKGRIGNAALALALYLMMFAILNFLIPGGLF